MNEVLKELISHIELPVDQLADQDPEIVEIFIEEVQEILESLENTIPQWIANPSDLDVLKDIRRAFHTLKGSGRMAGAVQSGELAWSIEEMLNRVMAGTVTLNKDIQDLVFSVATLYPNLVEDFQALAVHTFEFRPWIVAAQQLRDNQELNEVLRFTVDYHQDKAIPTDEQDSLGVVEIAPIVESQDEAADIEFTLDAAQEEQNQAELSPIANAVEEKTELLTQMMEIFLEESNEHLQTISEFLQLQQDPSLEQYNQLIRAIHTIRGSSGMVEIEALFSASTYVENVFKNLSQEEGEKHLLEHQLLLDYYEYVKSYATVLAQGTNVEKFQQLDQQFAVIWAAFSEANGTQIEEINTQGLVAKLLDLEINELLDAEFSFVEQIQERKQSYLNQLTIEAQLLSSNTNLRQTESLNKIVNYLARCYTALLEQDNFHLELVVIEELQQLHQYLVDAFDGLASGQNMVITHLMAEEFEAIINTISTQNQTVVEPEEELIPVTTFEVPVQLESIETDPPIATNTDFDPDLLAIFLEESEELVIGMDDDFATWERDPKNPQVLKNLFRYLHTLKGGANMVQATHLGDIAHELESIYERVLKGALVPNDAMMQTIRYAQDEIATRLQRLAEQQMDEANPKLIQNLRAILNGTSTVFVADHQEDNTPIALENAVEVEELLAPIVENTTSGEAIQVAEAQPANTDFDVDLLSIFLEESEELVAGMDEDFNTWEQNPKNTTVLKNLFRYLHTLKGGANMVQATHLGNIAHELESIYERVLKGQIQPNATAMQTIRYAQDEIATRLQYLASKHIDEDNPTLIAQLRAIVVGGAVAQTTEKVESIEKTVVEAIVTTPIIDTVAIEVPVSEIPLQDELQIATSLSENDLTQSEKHIPAALAKAIKSGDESQIIIVQSYYEEAEELLENGENLFAQWSVERNNRSILLGLQRVYHTLKGNSRVVEEQLIALMAYQLEYVFEQYSIHEFTSDRYDGLLRHTQKWLKNAIFSGHFDGAEALKARLQNISYEESLVPEDTTRLLTETIDFMDSDVVEITMGDGSEPPLMYQEAEKQQDTSAQEQIRISADLVEKLIDLSGETAINRSRIELDLGQMTYTLTEMEQAIHRLADQLRRMEGELEAQILAKHESEGGQRYVDFDPLEMDQYSSLNQLSKSLAESASDLIDFKSTLADKIRDTENLLLQQSRIQNELQQSLMGTRLVPFSRLVPRLQRLVRQTSTQLNRPVELNIENTEGELDRNILERLVNPLEHMLRNAIDHGIEDSESRQAAGKSATGHINLNIAREGNDILVIFSDDGRGISVDAVKAKAQNNGLITPDMNLSDVDIMQYIFHSGLSTAQKVTQISGRGVGLDVVQNEIKSLGGHVSVTSTLGRGAEFTIRVPTTVAVSNALMVKVGDQQFALPLAQIERIVRVSPVALMEYYDSQSEQFELDQSMYRLRYVGEFITGQMKPHLSNMGTSVPVIIYNSGGRSVALQVDQLVGSRAQIVIKPIGQQLSSVGFVGGATILADGRVCLILDGQTVSRRALTTPRAKQDIEEVTAITETRTVRRTIMVVDDSVTVRKVTTRLLERQGFDVVAAKDGVDALEKLAQVTPDLMLLDIEMPRMDGFEVAQYVRHDSQQRDLPIIMITSRTGEKHRERAFSLGVNQYMGKPFQEAELLENITALLETEKVN